MNKIYRITTRTDRVLVQHVVIELVHHADPVYLISSLPQEHISIAPNLDESLLISKET